MIGCRIIALLTHQRRLTLSLVFVAIVIGVAAFLAFPRTDAESQKLLEAARVALKGQKWDEAGVAARRVLELTDESSEAALILGEAASRQGKMREALTWYEQVSRDDAELAVKAAFASGEILRTSGLLSFAEECYREAIDLVPDHASAHGRMSLLLRLTGRPFEAMRHQQTLVRLGLADPTVLMPLLDRTRVDAAVDFLESCRTVAAEDPLPIFGLAAIATGRGNIAEATELWEQGLFTNPDAAEAVVSLAHLLNQSDERGGETKLRHLITRAPASCGELPGFWLLIADLAAQHRKQKDIVGYVAEAVRLDPDNGPAVYRLGMSLGSQDRQTSDSLLHRAELLERLEALGARLNNPAARPKVLPEVISTLQQLGRHKEADAWTGVSAGSVLNADILGDSALASDGAMDWDASLRTIARVSIDDVRQPSWWQTSHDSVDVAVEELHFVDEAESVGLKFQYFESPDETTEGRRMFEFTGGGVAVLDFDRDGTPDVYLTQGTQWPVGSSGEMSDQVFRNLDYERFENTTQVARVHEPGFSQGVSAGDIDSDGFPDLYVANFGQNRLFRNNGDGTFSDLKSTTLTLAPAWTTSCVIADLNGDLIADLYDVNYVEGPLVASEICITEAGPRVCTPQGFDAAQDVILFGTGDGNFKRAGDAAGLNDVSGKGLGIVVANLDSDPQLEVFIANDSVRNNLLDPRPTTNGELHYSDVALAAGLAFSADGNSQACMGVAVADLTGNGRHDLFVTNFFNESNALYQNQSELLFRDTAAESNLRAPSIRMLGFGTQALDVDLDGDSDLVVANGDIDDFASIGRPVRMKPQLFINDGAGRFQEAVLSNESDYFFSKSAHCGRSVARLDWNGDGRMDFVVGHLGEPTALVTNRSIVSGHSVSIQLIATNSHRDAIGAKLSVSGVSSNFSEQVVAGDGYQASNQRQLVVTLPAVGEAKLAVDWPDGTTAEYVIPDSGKRYAVVQGRDPALLP